MFSSVHSVSQIGIEEQQKVSVKPKMVQFPPSFTFMRSKPPPVPPKIQPKQPPIRPIYSTAPAAEHAPEPNLMKPKTLFKSKSMECIGADMGTKSLLEVNDTLNRIVLSQSERILNLQNHNTELNDQIHMLEARTVDPRNSVEDANRLKEENSQLMSRLSSLKSHPLKEQQPDNPQTVDSLRQALWEKDQLLQFKDDLIQNLQLPQSIRDSQLSDQLQRAQGELKRYLHLDTQREWECQQLQTQLQKLEHKLHLQLLQNDAYQLQIETLQKRSQLPCSQCTKYSQEFEELRYKIKAASVLKRRWQEAEQENSKLMGLLNQQGEAMQKQRREYQADLEQLEKDIEVVGKEIQDGNNKLTQYENERVKFRALMKELSEVLGMEAFESVDDAAFETIVARTAFLSNELESTKDELKTLHTQVTEIEQSVKVRDVEIDRLKATVLDGRNKFRLETSKLHQLARRYVLDRQNMRQWAMIKSNEWQSRIQQLEIQLEAKEKSECDQPLTMDDLRQPSTHQFSKSVPNNAMSSMRPLKLLLESCVDDLHRLDQIECDFKHRSQSQSGHLSASTALMVIEEQSKVESISATLIQNMRLKMDQVWNAVADKYNVPKAVEESDDGETENVKRELDALKHALDAKEKEVESAQQEVTRLRRERQVERSTLSHLIVETCDQLDEVLHL